MALMSMKFLFDDNCIESEEEAKNYISDVQLPCWLNLTNCYLKTSDFHNCIYYSTKVLDLNDNSVKAYYRRGFSYLSLGEFDKAKGDLLKAHELSNKKDNEVIKGLKLLKEK
jgi:tetratricopeptide (TPR) repeat protein